METPTNSQLEPQLEGSDQQANNLSQAETTVVDTSLNNKTAAELVEALAVLLQGENLPSRAEVDTYKKAFYRRKQYVMESASKESTENAEKDQEDLAENIEVHEERLKDLLSLFREKYQKIKEEEDALKGRNIELKQDLIGKLTELLKSTDEFGKIVADFKLIREEWDAIGAIPEQQANEIQSNYNRLVEQFYDLKQINDEFREYDFRKNLEAKTALCEEAEALTQLEDVIQATRKLQDLHKQWRDLGPVARDLRESIWARFKAASTIVNKRHQEHFDQLKATESNNLERKEALCLRVEEIKTDDFSSPKQWDEATRIVLQVQGEWKTIGFAPKKDNEKVYLRFRGACDAFFSQKSLFYAQRRKEHDENYAKKKAMVEEAESLKESSYWKATADRLIELQNEWKKVGPIPRRQSDAIWTKFRSACDYFFARKKEANEENGSSWTENLKAKEEIIAQLETLEGKEDDQETRDLFAELTAKFKSIGFVPFKDKDKIQKAYKAVSDRLYSKLRISRNNKRLEGYSSSLDQIDENGKGKLMNERTRMMRILDRMRQELQTYTNNLGFLSAGSKSGNSLLNEMKKKKDRLVEDIQLMEQKINLIDERIDHPEKTNEQDKEQVE